MVSYLANENYIHFNQQISSKYFNNQFQCRAYLNPQMAVYDIASGLQQFLAHKAHFAVVKKGSALIENLSPIWTRNAFPLQIKNESQNWYDFIESLNKETNFVIWASENEITGEVLVESEVANEIHQRLAAKRIFSIQIVHHYKKEDLVSPYSIKILRPSLFESKMALAVAGEKYKVPTQVGGYQNLVCSVIELENFFQPEKKQDFDLIAKLEKQYSTEKHIYFNRYVQTTPRFADRIVFNFSQVNAFAIQNDIKLSDDQAFAASCLPFWILDLWKNWWSEAENEVFLRGLLVVSLTALRQDSDLMLKISHSVNKFERLGQMIDL